MDMEQEITKEVEQENMEKVEQENTKEMDQDESKDVEQINKMEDMEEDGNKDADKLSKAYAEPESSQKITPASLKAKSKIAKNSSTNNINTEGASSAAEGTSQPRRLRRRKKGKNVQGKNESSEDVKEGVNNLVPRDSTQQKGSGDEQGAAENSDQDGKNKEKEPKTTNAQPPGERNQPQKKGGKIIELSKINKSTYTKKNHENSNKNATSDKKKEKQDLVEKSRTKKKNEKLGGLIFMCSAKTKPDCYRYSVMGVTMAKKDIVLGVKPGLKLFLYDFDLKLMYGIYRASSSGGMKLEPKAFGGAFPVQVRFTLEKDCFPLPESVFKKAIKENYDERKKFKTELTFKQIRKLSELFRPVEIRSTLQASHPTQVAVKRDREAWDREVVDRDREAHHHSRWKTSDRNHHTSGYGRNYDALRERDQHLAHRDVTHVQREEVSRDLYLTEKEYRAYGLRGDVRNLPPISHNSALENHQRGYEREYHPRLLDSTYRDNIQVESLLAGPLSLNESDYQAYARGSRQEVAPATATPAAVLSYSHDPHRYADLLGESYLQPSRRDELPAHYLIGDRILVEAGSLRRESIVDRLYSAYSTDAVSAFNQTQHYHDGGLPTSVSSRYSFAGPSHSLR